MSRITGKDTKPELLLRSMLHRRGFRFTVNGPKNKKLPGRPLLGICFWRKVREERIWAEYMGEKGGYTTANNPKRKTPTETTNPPMSIP